MTHIRLSQLRGTILFLLFAALCALGLLAMTPPGTVQAASSCGSAPSSYGTITATTSSSLAINGANGFLCPLTPLDYVNSQYVWTVPVTNTTGSTAYLFGWIDFDNNGQFGTSSPTEYVSSTVASVASGGATTATLTWTLPSGMPISVTTWARLILRTTNTAVPTGTIGIGESDDFQIFAVRSTACDAGTSFYFIGHSGDYVTTIYNFNASTGVSSTLYSPASGQQGDRGVNGLAVDRTREQLYYQKASSDSTAQSLYYYDLFTKATGTVITSSTSPSIGLTPLSSGWRSASGAFANNRYYVGFDGDSSGAIYEVTLNSSGDTAVSARVLFTPTLSCTKCDYGDLIVNGNRIYVSISDGSTNHMDIYDINSSRTTRLRLNSNTFPVDGSSGGAVQLARDGNGQIYGIVQKGGAVYMIAADGSATATSYRTNSQVTDASECLLTNPTAVTLSSFGGSSVAVGASGRWIPIGLFAGAVLAGAGSLVIYRRLRRVT